MNPFIDDYKSWVKEALGDPSFSKRITDARFLRELRVANTKVFERLMRVSGPESNLGYTEVILTIEPDTEFYKLPGNFRQFIALQRRLDNNNPNKIIGRYQTKPTWQPGVGIRINSAMRGFQLEPRPILDATLTYLMAYQARPIILHYANATSATGSGVPVLGKAEEVVTTTSTADDGAATGITEGVTDTNVDTGGITDLSVTNVLRLEFESDVSNVAADDLIKVYIDGQAGADDWAMLAYTDSDTVTATGKITVTGGTDGWQTFTLTTAFQAQLGDLGDGSWAVRVGPDGTDTRTGRVRDIETTFAKEKVKSRLVLPATVTAAQGELILEDQYYQGSLFHIVSADEGAGQINECIHFNGKTRTAVMRFPWNPVPTGTIQYELLPVIVDPYSRLIALSAAINFAMERRDYQGRRAMIEEWRELFSAAKHFYASTTQDRPPTFRDVEPGADDPYGLYHITRYW